MSSAIRSGAGKAIESVVATRSMFVKVKPIPATLSQRRAVLKALQRYGDIEVFKKLAVSCDHHGREAIHEKRS